MINLRRTIEERERGTSLVELSVSMFGLAFVAAIMLSWFVGANRVDELQRNDDEVIQDLRISRELLTKDLRRARSITAADVLAVTMWLDTDRDDIVDGGELITWEVEGDGDFVRSTDLGIETVHARSLLTGSSAFTYDDVVAASVTAVHVTLVAGLDTGSTRSMSVEISMRNG